MTFLKSTFHFWLNNKHFPDSLCVEWLDGKRWRLISSFSYHRNNGEIIIVPKDFITDFGSKPPIVWIFIGSPTDEGGPAYLVHDFLCYIPNYPKSKADRIFYEAMRDLGVPYLKRTVMYFSVRVWHGFR